MNGMYVMGNGVQPVIETTSPSHPHPHGHPYHYSTDHVFPNSHPYPHTIAPSGPHQHGNLKYPLMVPPGFVPHQGMLSGNAPANAKTNQDFPVDKKGSKKLQHIFKNAKGKNSNSEKETESTKNQADKKTHSQK